jgi:hypothetical protein
MIHSGVQGKKQVQERMQKVIYVVWNLWKERCRRVFDNRAMSADQLIHAIKDDVTQWQIAWSSLVPAE